MDNECNRLKKIYIESYGFEIVKLITYSYKEFTKDVFIVRKQNSTRSQTSPWGDIFLNEVLLKKYSKNVQDFFFLHEYRHATTNRFLRLLVFLTIVFLFPFLPLNLISTYNSSINFFNNPSIENIVATSKNMLLFLLNCFLIISVNWINELHAELWGIKQIGLITYLSICQELDIKRTDLSIINKINRFIQMPPLKLILLLYENFYKNT